MITISFLTLNLQVMEGILLTGKDGEVGKLHTIGMILLADWKKDWKWDGQILKYKDQLVSLLKNKYEGTERRVYKNHFTETANVTP